LASGIHSSDFPALIEESDEILSTRPNLETPLDAHELLEKEPSNDVIMGSFRDLESSKAEFEKSLQMAKTLGISIDVAEDQPNLIESINSMINGCISATKNAIKAAKETLARESWIPNREMIHQSLRRLQMSAQALDELVKTKSSHLAEEEEYSVYPLGLMGGGERSEPTMLFSLPNDGNITFPFSISTNPHDRIAPNETSSDIFMIEPNKGLLEPGQSLDIIASFQGTVSGNYRQGFVLKTGEVVISMFSVIGTVGNPILKFNPEILDCGLVAIGQSVTNYVSIKNSGTYEGDWEFIVEKNSCVKFGPQLGKTERLSNSKVNVTFKARTKGDYEYTANLVWKFGQLPLVIKAIGGESIMEFIYPSDYQGLDFKTVLVGLKCDRKLIIKNIGNIESLLTVAHPNSNIKFQVERNEKDEINIPAGGEKEFLISFHPTAIEKMKDAIVFSCTNSSVGFYNVNIIGLAQTQEWKVEGALDFVNVSVGNEQVKSITVKNNGTSPIPFEYAWEPGLISEIFELDFGEWKVANLLKAKETVTIKVSLKSDTAIKAEGELVLKSTILGVVDLKKFNFSFKVFAAELETAESPIDDEEHSRVNPGEMFEKTQNITNNGNKNIRYRATIENDKGDTWAIESNSEGLIVLI
jgi:hypothetical protein